MCLYIKHIENTSCKHSYWPSSCQYRVGQRWPSQLIYRPTADCRAISATRRAARNGSSPTTLELSPLRVLGQTIVISAESARSSRGCLSVLEGSRPARFAGGFLSTMLTYTETVKIIHCNVDDIADKFVTANRISPPSSNAHRRDAGASANSDIYTL